MKKKYNINIQCKVFSLKKNTQLVNLCKDTKLFYTVQYEHCINAARSC